MDFGAGPWVEAVNFMVEWLRRCLGQVVAFSSMRGEAVSLFLLFSGDAYIRDLGEIGGGWY